MSDREICRQPTGKPWNSTDHNWLVVVILVPIAVCVPAMVVFLPPLMGRSLFRSAATSSSLPYFLQDSLIIFRLVTLRSPASLASASLLSFRSVFSSLAASAAVS